MPKSQRPAVSTFSQISLIAVPMISTPASTCSPIDKVRRLSASAGVPNSGLRVRRSVNTTGSAARPITAPVTMRSAVPSVWLVVPISSGHRGSTKKKYKTPAAIENDACQATATLRPILLLKISGPGSDQLSLPNWSPLGPSAEDRGFEPLRAINPTRVPGERHRPLGESSAGHGNRPARHTPQDADSGVVTGTGPGLVLA